MPIGTDLLVDLQNFIDFLQANQFATVTLGATLLLGFVLLAWTLREVFTWFFRTKKILQQQEHMLLQIKQLEMRIRRMDKNLDSFAKEGEKNAPLLVETPKADFSIDAQKSESNNFQLNN